METGSIVAYLFSKKLESVEIEPGEKIPEKVMANLRKYNLVIPINQYEKLSKGAEKEGTTIQEKVFSKYRYITKIPKEWEVIPLT
ncbi:hypothetical protein AKJ58_01155 [candidate division MSBL1 archaeon SCGC-AAA385D11]|uniref:Uncharacterized protein n=1 Tax=candidate division MSBL1 archaeon SCGC-AAA385D11 TaxID=1698286 RepID=A0A133VNN3_9EURY|nr:hypothetical protein AKJ58_01155 [candidate division MSBL1 archaeon SCGC-AAA385D11]